MDVAAEKQRQRTKGIAARAALDDGLRRRFDRAIAARVLALPEFDRAAVVLSYCAVHGEADPGEIDAAARRLKKQVAYPLCYGGGRMGAAIPEEPGAVQRGMYGIPAPDPARCRIVAPEEIGLVLVPCAAFDRFCRRVGMGGGYYDRYLPLCENAFAVGLAYEAQRVRAAAAEDHDRPLHGAVSEARLYRREEQNP